MLMATKQPALVLFKAMPLSDPRRLLLLPKTLNSYKILNIEHSSGEWQIYTDAAANSELPQDLSTGVRCKNDCFR